MTAAALNARVLRELPPPLQGRARRHPAAEREDFVQDLWVEFLESRAQEKINEIAQRARSNTRRYTQDHAHFASSIEDGFEPQKTLGDVVKSGERKGDAARAIAQKEGITVRAAQLRIKAQRERAAMGDLFGSLAGGVA